MIDPESVKVLSKVVAQVYEDALSPAMKELGNVAGWFIRFLTPFVPRAKKEVPPQFVVEPPLNVAGPVFENVRFVEDGTIHQELYINLMLKAIDSRAQADAHNDYPRIIAALSPLEAFFLYDLAQVGCPVCQKVSNDVMEPTEEVIRENFPQYAGWTKEQLYAALDHLKSLGLVDESETKVGGFRPDSGDWRVYIGISSFGNQFIKTCLPDKQRVEEIRTKAPRPGSIAR
jgi:hypothetical protein